MIPETFGALLTFLGFVAPGVAYELLRERRRPSIEETTFREASRVALTSLVFTVTTLILLAVIRYFDSTLVADPSAWLREGDAYVQNNLPLVATTLCLHLAIAFSLAVIADWLFRQSAPGRIVPGSIWFQLFRQRCPRNATPWLHVRLDDETEVWGYVGDYTPDHKLENRELTIFGPKLRYRRKGDTESKPLEKWSSIAVRGDEISWMKVTYVANDSPLETPKLLLARKPATGLLRRLAARTRSILKLRWSQEKRTG